MRTLSGTGFLVRWLAALGLVMASFNPAGYSYYHWAVGLWPAGSIDDNLPIKAIVGLGLVIAYVIFIRATWRSIGPIGLGLVGAFFGAILWALFYYVLLQPDQTTVIAYILLVVAATVMAIGLSWSHIRRRLSGQLDTTEIPE